MQAIILLLLLWVAPETSDLKETLQPAWPANRLALHLDTPDPHEDDLHLTLQAGISILVADSLHTPLISSVPDDILIFYDIGISYLLPSQSDRDKESVIHDLSQRITSIPEDHRNRIAAFGLFRLPLESTSFHLFSGQVADSLRPVTNKPFYYRTYRTSADPPPEAFEFAVADFHSDLDSPAGFSAPVVYFHPSRDVHLTIQKLEQMLNESLKFEQSILVLPFSWLSEIISEQPGIALMLQEFQNGTPVTLPQPADVGREQPANGHLIIFWVLAGAFIILVRYYPLIPVFAGRYFLNHTFFIQDIMEGRIRNLKSGIYFLIIQSLFTGLFFYTLMYSLFSDPGFAVFEHFISWNLWDPDPALSLAILVVIISLLIHMVSVSWLYLLIKDINQLYKAVNLYAWGFMAPLILTVIFTGLTAFELPWSFAGFLGGIFYVMWILPFLIASYHGTKKIEKNRYAVLFSTFGIFIILAAALPAILLGWDKLMEILQLAYVVSG